MNFNGHCKRLLGGLLMGILLFQVSFGQTKEEEKKFLESYLYQFAKDYSNLPVSKNKQTVLKYFSPEATSNIFVFNISGAARVQNSNYNGFSAFLDKVLRAGEMTIDYKITDIIDIEVGEKIATAVYKVDYEIKETDGIWVKGKETVTMAFEKNRDIWQIVHYTFLQIEDEKLKGTCLCELFIAEVNDGQVVSKTTVPSGKNYSVKFDSFDFRTVGADQRIKIGDRIYTRLSSGMLVANEDGEEIELGVSNSKKETVLMILGQSLYKDSCARLKSKEVKTKE